MKIKTSELTGPALDWAVAKAQDLVLEIKGKIVLAWLKDALGKADHLQVNYRPTRSWAQGGPIIEDLIKEKFQLMKGEFNTGFKCIRITANEEVICMFGPTPLIAAMRSRVASKLGDEVDVPKELLKDD